MNRCFPWLFYSILFLVSVSTFNEAIAFSIQNRTLNQIDSVDQVSSGFEEGFKEKYLATEEFNYRKESSSFFEEMQKSILDIVSAFFEFLGLGAKFAAGFYRIILFIVFGLVCYFFVNHLIEGELLGFRKNNKLTDDSIDDQDIVQQINNQGFEQLIKGALDKNDFRLAIRYYYIHLIEELSKARKIKKHKKKTNQDYYYEISNPKQAAIFKYATFLYDQVWYGDRELSDDKFRKAKAPFDKILNNLSK